MNNTTLKLPGVLVSVEWLAEHLEHPDLVLLDASQPAPGQNKEATHLAARIGNAVPFDLKKVSDPDHSLPNMMPTADFFTKEVQKLGVDAQDTIVIYDTWGIYSSPRAWWMFQTMGHQKVAVLDGGLPAWQKAGFEVNTTPAEKEITEKGNFQATFQAGFICSSQEVLKALDTAQTHVVDARSEGRFLGVEPEPRAGLKGGHMPNAINLPFKKLFQEGKMLPVSDLENIYTSWAKKEDQLLFTCGSGITACILALGATIAGYSRLIVYDGSWSEWGIPSENFPVTTAV